MYSNKYYKTFFYVVQLNNFPKTKRDLGQFLVMHYPDFAADAVMQFFQIRCMQCNEVGDVQCIALHSTQYSVNSGIAYINKGKDKWLTLQMSIF